MRDPRALTDPRVLTDPWFPVRARGQGCGPMAMRCPRERWRLVSMLRCCG
jgi:hypothetical protein